MKHAVQTGSVAMMYASDYIKTGPGVLKLMGRDGNRDTEKKEIT
jgi:hypothetical protein